MIPFRILDPSRDREGAEPGKPPALARARPFGRLRDGFLTRLRLAARATIVGLAALHVADAPPAGAAQWRPADGPLRTRWTQDVRPDHVHAEYPRPQMTRRQWLNLNGLWHYAIRPKDDPRPQRWDGEILVPFPVESALSGVMRRVGPQERLWYRRTWRVPADWSTTGRRVLLHFGAADWETTVWINGRALGTHRGGYDSFTFDVTDALNPDGDQELVVAVWDPTDAGTQPRGKQVRNPEGIWYTPTTGIWQTVWIEPVPQPPTPAPELARLTPVYLKSVILTPDLDRRRALVHASAATDPARGPVEGHPVQVRVFDGPREVRRVDGSTGQEISVELPDPHLWSPDDPFRYRVQVALCTDRVGDTPVVRDAVECWLGMRKVALGQDEHGVTRILLNDRPLFLFGTLDQGYWPDGLYAAPCDEALRYDLDVLRKLGFNAVRKHVKVEPQRWYDHCDQLGLLVLQDMPSGDATPDAGKREITRAPESAAQFETELLAVIDGLRNHPSVVMWIPFNEGWGQFDTQRIAGLVKARDPTRLVDCASGWHDFPVGDVHDVHAYPGPASPQPEPRRAALLGEFGGLGLPLSGHTWQQEKNWGYRSFASREELTDAYVRLIEQVRLLAVVPGLSGAIYTQTTDVEIEVNGLMTYDRAIIKPDADRVAAAARGLLGPRPTVRMIVPTSQSEAQVWRYTLEPPPPDWTRPEFDDRAWPSAAGGFGRPGTPGAIVRTEWTTSEIWLKRPCAPPDLPPANPHLLVHHDEDAEVYINGQLAATLPGYTTAYRLYPISAVSAEALRRSGPIHLAAHCRQTVGGQYIDVGLIDLVDPSDR